MDSSGPTHVVVVDVRMKFWSMVVFMVKWVIASIPALVILGFIGFIMTAIFHLILGVGPMWWHGRMH